MAKKGSFLREDHPLDNVKKILDSGAYKFIKDRIKKDKYGYNLTLSSAQIVNYQTALSVLNKQEENKNNPQRLNDLDIYLQKYPEINEITQAIKTARENPLDTQNLVVASRKAASISPRRRSDDDILTLMIANAVFTEDNSSYLSEQASQVIKDEGVTFGHGSFGGAGASGSWNDHPVQGHTSHEDQFLHNYDHHQTTTHDTTYHHDHGSYNHDSGPSFD